MGDDLKVGDDVVVGRGGFHRPVKITVGVMFYPQLSADEIRLAYIQDFHAEWNHPPAHEVLKNSKAVAVIGCVFICGEVPGKWTHSLEIVHLELPPASYAGFGVEFHGFLSIQSWLLWNSTRRNGRTP